MDTVDDRFRERLWRRFATRLSEAMRQRGYINRQGDPDQSRLAQAVHINQSAVSDWLNEHPDKQALPKSDALYRLCRVLKVSPDYLLFEAGSKDGGVAPAPESYNSGWLDAVVAMRRALEQVEAERRGGVAPPSPVVSLPTSDEREVAAEAADQDGKMRQTPGVQKRRRGRA